MSANDPLDKIFADAAAFDKLANAPAKPLSPKLQAEVNDMFSKSAKVLESNSTEHLLATNEVTSLLLMVLSRQSSTYLELIDALKKQNIVFAEGHGVLFGSLQKLEKQGYLTAEKKLRRERMLKVYTVTNEGYAFLQLTASEEQALNSLADQISAGIVLA